MLSTIFADPLLGFKTQCLKFGICPCDTEILYFTEFTVTFIHYYHSNVPAAVPFLSYKHAVKVQIISFASPFFS